jgi:hypothetical protein
MSITVDLAQKVKSVAEDGSATLEQSIEGLDMTSKIMGMTMTAGLKDGKLAYTMNGQAFAPPNTPAGNPFAGTTFETRLAPSGRVLETKSSLNEALKQATGGRDITQMFGLGGMQGVGMIVFPEEPLRVGSQWENKSSVPIPMLMPGPPGAPEGKMELKRVNTLKAIEQKDGHPVAIIETNIEVSMPRTEIPLPAEGGKPAASPVTIEKMTQTVAGTSRFDVTDGALQAGDYTAKVGMQMKMPTPAAAGAPRPGAGTMGMDGNFRLKADLQPQK